MTDQLLTITTMIMQNRFVPKATLVLAVFASLVGTLQSARARNPLNQIVASIPVGTAPWGIVVSPDSSTVYVANEGGPGTVSVIHAATNTVKFVIPTDVSPTGLAISPDGRAVYAVCELGTALDVISTATDTVTSRVSFFPDKPSEATGSITLSPDGSQLYYPVGNSIIVIDTRTLSVSTISLGSSMSVASQVVFTAKKAKAYVVGFGARGRGVLGLIDTASQRLISTQKIGGTRSLGIAIHPSTGRLYISSSTRENGATEIAIAHAANDKVFKGSVLQAFASENGLALTTDGKYLYVIGFPENGLEKVYTVDSATGKQIGQLLAVQGESFWPMAMAPDGKHGYLSCDLGSTTNGVVTVVDVREESTGNRQGQQ